MPVIRTTFDPNHDLTVSEIEYQDLLRQGLVVGGPPPPNVPTAMDVALQALALAKAAPIVGGLLA